MKKECLWTNIILDDLIMQPELPFDQSKLTFIEPTST